MAIVGIKYIFWVLGTSPGTYGSNEPANSAQLIRATDLSPPVISFALPLYASPVEDGRLLAVAPLHICSSGHVNIRTL